MAPYHRFLNTPLIHRSIETPVKRLRLELEGEGSKKQGVLSPTANLPNLVRDGLNKSSRTPTSARKKGAVPSDWLTNLSREDQMTYGVLAYERGIGVDL